MERESYAHVITEIHGAIEKNNFEKVIEIIRKVPTTLELDEISQTFLLTYHYNFKNRFLEKADFNYCMKFSNLLNKRTH